MFKVNRTSVVTDLPITPEELASLHHEPDLSLPKVVRLAMSEWLGLNIQSRMDLVTISQRGIKASRFYAFQQQNSWLGDDVYNHIVSPQSLSYERSRNLHLSRTETNRFIRVMKVAAIARCVFGDEEKAGQWLSTPRSQYSDMSPVELLKTEDGASLVTEHLIEIDEANA